VGPVGHEREDHPARAEGEDDSSEEVDTSCAGREREDAADRVGARSVIEAGHDRRWIRGVREAYHQNQPDQARIARASQLRRTATQAVVGCRRYSRQISGNLAQEAGTGSRAAALRASPPIFASPVLDRLTRIHPAVPVLIFLPAIVVFAVLAFRGLGAGAVVGVAVAGYVFWTLAEYWFHRIVFHFEPENGLGARLHWMIHGVHHDHPNDPRRLVLPPALSVPLAALFALAFVAVLGTPLAWAFTAGFYAGYLAYDMLHFALHHHKPKTRIGKRLHELHMRHHFEDDTRGFGVSAPWWDLVFRTAPRSKGETRTT
jgi:hypothetical protein